MPKRDTEFKQLPQFVKAVDGSKVEGVFSVMGVIDSYNDITRNGAFAKTFAERGGKTLHLWQHDFYSPPTAVVKELYEVDRTGLPELLQIKYPQATGGAIVVREYIDSPRANEILSLIKAGSPLQMSFGYDAIRYEYKDDEELGTVRYLNEIRLWETSDVLWGANEATQASKQRPSIPLDTLLGQLDNWLKSFKAGARNSENDLQRINQIGVLAYELGATSVKLIGDEEGKSLVAAVIDEAIAETADEVKAADSAGQESDPVIVVTKAEIEEVEPEAVTEIEEAEGGQDAPCTCDHCGCAKANEGSIGGAADKADTVDSGEDTEIVIEVGEEQERRAGTGKAVSLTLLSRELELLLLDA